MIDDTGAEMENVGHVSNLAKVAISLMIDDGKNGDLFGTLETAFLPADGRAIFDNFFLNGTNKKVRFEFTMISAEYQLGWPFGS